MRYAYIILTADENIVELDLLFKIAKIFYKNNDDFKYNEINWQDETSWIELFLSKISCEDAILASELSAEYLLHHFDKSIYKTSPDEILPITPLSIKPLINCFHNLLAERKIIFINSVDQLKKVIQDF